MLTYDEIWMAFLDDYKINEKDLPDTDERVYNDINNAVRKFNNRLRTELKCDNVSETVDGTDSEDDLLLIAQYLKLIYLKNQKTLFESLYQPISQDVGIKNYSSQMNALEKSIIRQDEEIDFIILNTRSKFI